MASGSHLGCELGLARVPEPFYLWHLRPGGPGPASETWDFTDPALTTGRGASDHYRVNLVNSIERDAQKRAFILRQCSASEVDDISGRPKLTGFRLRRQRPKLTPSTNRALSSRLKSRPLAGANAHPHDQPREWCVSRRWSFLSIEEIVLP